MNASCCSTVKYRCIVQCSAVLYSSVQLLSLLCSEVLCWVPLCFLDYLCTQLFSCGWWKLVKPWESSNRKVSDRYPNLGGSRAIFFPISTASLYSHRQKCVGAQFKTVYYIQFDKYCVWTVFSFASHSAVFSPHKQFET